MPPEQPLAGAGGEGVMVVVPAFAEGEDRDDRVVDAVVGAFEGLGAPDVADGVDAPSHVLEQANAGDAAPDQARDRSPANCDGTSPRRRLGSGS